MVEEAGTPTPKLPQREETNAIASGAEPPLRLRDLAVHERPQERLQNHGAAALSETELLALLLRSGGPRLDVLGVSRTLLQRAGSLQGLLRWSAEDFQQIPGIGRVKALQMVTVMEFARRVLRESEGTAPPLLDSPEKVFRHFHIQLAGLDVEKFFTCALNRKNRLLRQFEITSGTATSSLVHPREVFRGAIRVSATGIIAVHNHPSGDPSPSSADIQVTRMLREAGKTLDLPLMDHVIIGSPERDPHGRGYYSFSEAGLV